MGQFLTEIDGLDIHFLHVRSPHAGARPLILTHGWPGSVIEFMRVIGPLSDPVAHGGKAEDAFDVIVPSLPGYGFSDKPARHRVGRRVDRRAWAELMRRLGYDALVRAGRRLGRDRHHRDGRAGARGARGDPPQHARRPPNPRGLRRSGPRGAAAIAAGEHYRSTGRLFDPAEHPTADASAMRWSIRRRGWRRGSTRRCTRGPTTRAGRKTRCHAMRCSTTSCSTGCRHRRVGGAALLGELRRTSAARRRCCCPPASAPSRAKSPRRRANGPSGCSRNIVYWHDCPRGGHFAAWEQPELFVEELRAAFRSFR